MSVAAPVCSRRQTMQGQGRFVDVVICSDKKTWGRSTFIIQFVFGNSGSGKSDYLYEYVLEQAAEHPKQNFLICAY